MSRILIIQTAFIGDLVLATGVLEKIHNTFPEVRLDILVRKGNEQLFLNHPYLNQVLIWNKQQHKYIDLIRLLFYIRRQRYDKVINLQRYAATGFLTGFSGAKEKIGFDKNPFQFLFTTVIQHQFGTGRSFLHEIERNHLLIADFTDVKVAKPKLYPTEKDVQLIRDWQTEPYICIAPASVWFTKQFPKDQWIELIRAIHSQYKIYLLGAPGDRNLCNDIVHETESGNVINLAGKISFLQSAALMQRAVMNYVNDSAPMHFASAMNAPVTAVYCSTIPAYGYGPLSTLSFIVETQLVLSCRPCGLHGKKSCPLNHFDCARSITIDQLLQSIPAL